jgi:hypothetical protein
MEETKTVGRNEPCPCGSGRKYKRCHGIEAPPKLSAPAAPAFGAGDAGAVGPAGFDPSKMDPQVMMQMGQMIQRLPKGQLQRLQSLMQRAMAGKDVTREAAELERQLPLEFEQMMRSFNPASLGFGGEVAPEEVSAPPMAETSSPVAMTEEEAKAIVARAMAEGKVSQDEAVKLLGDEAAPVTPETRKPGGLWGKLRGK